MSYSKTKYDENWKKVVVRSGIRTHAHRSGLRPERSALDLSAILTHTTLSSAANDAEGQRARVTTFCSCVRRTPVSHHRGPFSSMWYGSGWPRGLRRCVQVAVHFCGRGFESHF